MKEFIINMKKRIAHTANYMNTGIQSAACSVLGIDASIWAFALALPLPIGICIWKIAMNHLHRKKKLWNVHMEMPLLPILVVGFLPAYILKFGGFI